MSRWKAAAIHFGLSAAIATVLLAAMLFLWYPPPYFTLMGGFTLVVLIAGCDVVLGPSMTIVVFKAGKKSLVFDLAVIAFLQMSALTYGLYTMFEARPVFTVFAVDRFEVTAANEIRGDELKRASRPEFASLPLTGPRVVGALPPTDPNEKLQLALASMTGGADIKSLPHLYTPYRALAASAAKRAKPITELERNHPEARDALVAKLGDKASNVEAVGFVPIVGRFRSMAAIVDRKSGELEAVIDANPW
jgi:hypothetical protein